jgi:cleavage and polyadenylation specificity factor subunit 1
MRSGQFTIYELHPVSQPDPPPSAARTSSLSLRFVKVHSRAFEIQRTEEVEKSVLAEQKRISRLLIPFVTSPAPGVTFSGVFFTGDRPSWILASDKSGVTIHPSGHTVVHSFTTCSLWESKGDFLFYSEEVRLTCLL